MKKRMSFILFFLYTTLSLTTISSFAEDTSHTLIKPIPKSILIKSSEHKEYIYEFPYYDKKTNIVDFKKVHGTLLKLNYSIFGKDKQRADGIFSSVEIIRTYKDFATEKGGEILWERAEGGRLTFFIPKPDGDKLWCQVSASNGFYELDIVAKKLEVPKVTPLAKAMKKELDVEGRITIYSILFDFDKYDLRNDSRKLLQEIAELLSGYPALKIEIQGHTDNLGGDSYNLELSQKRAEAVMQYMTGHGIVPSRLIAKGYGSLKPIGSNNTRKGRERNRRVVLVER